MIYINNSRIKYNLWFFVHTNILYIYQRTSIMIWLNTINGLSSKFIKTIKFNFNFINLYRNIIMYLIIFVFILLLI